MMPSASTTTAQIYEASCSLLHFTRPLRSLQAFQHHYAWSEEDPALAAAGDMGLPMFCFETAIKASVAQGAAVPHAECTAC